MQKKRKHPNFIDIAFILLLVAVAAVAYLLSHSQTEAVETVKRTYVVEVSETDPAMAEQISVGDSVVDNIRNYAIGTVSAVEVLPSTRSVLDETQGKYVLAEVPGEICLRITIEADTVDSGVQIATVSGYVLQVGAEISCSMDDYYAVGYIIGLSR